MKDPTLRRRAAMWAAACLATSTRPLITGARLLPATLPLSPRLDANTLTPLTAVGVVSAPSDLRYPEWLKGTWRVNNTISKFTMPLGAAFVDPFLRATAQEDVNAAQTLSYTLSFVDAQPPPSDLSLCVKQDRRFNAVEETAAFLASEGVVVTNGAYEVSAPYPHGRITLETRDPNAAGDSKVGSAASVVGRGDGDVGGKSRIDLSIEWAAWDEAASGGAFVTSELAVQRVVLPRDAYFDESVDTTFLEIITRFERPRITAGSNGKPVVHARNRLVEYLSLPGIDASAGSDGGGSRARAQERLANGRAISFFDYDWVMEKVDDGTGIGFLGSPQRV